MQLIYSVMDTVCKHKNVFKSFLLILFFQCFFIQNLHATHVVGGVLEYTYMGPGGLPNSSRFKIRMKLWRDAEGNPWFPVNPVIECRGDSMLPFDPVLKSGIDNFTDPRSGLGRFVPVDGNNNINRAFIRDFNIGCGIPADTLTVRGYSNNPSQSNTRILPSSLLPYYENPFLGTITTFLGLVNGTYTILPTNVSTTVTGSPAAESINNLSDNNDFNKWLIFQRSGSAIFDFGSPQLFNAYRMVTGNDTPDRDPRAWSIQGSNSSISGWVTLDSRNQNLNNARNFEQQFYFANSTPYRFYRWIFTNVRRDAINMMQISEFDLGTASPPEILSRLSNGYPNNQFLINNHGFTKGICNSSNTGLGDLSSFSSNENDCERFTNDPYIPGVSDYQRTCVSQNAVDSCSSINYDIRIQYGEYIRVVDLPNIPGGYHLRYTLCCRNGAVKNVVDDSYSVYARIPDFSVYDQTRRNITVSNQFHLKALTDANNTTNNPTTIISISGIFTTLGVNATYIALSESLLSLGLSTSLGVGLAGTIPGLSQITTTGRTNLPTNIRNSSPSFKTTPPLFLCQYNDLLQQIELAKDLQEKDWRNPPYDHGATDLDGDSLVYDLVPALDGDDRASMPYWGSWEGSNGTIINGTTFDNGTRLYATMPVGTPASFPNNVNINTFNSVPYRTQGADIFTPLDPFGTPGIGSYTSPSPSVTVPSGIVIDKSTGKLICKPRVPTGLYVVGVRCREFRRGTGEFLGEITRDYQFRIEKCFERAVGDALGNFNYNGDLYTRACDLNSVQIVNNSSSSALLQNVFYWDNGFNRYSSLSDAVTVDGIPMQARYDNSNNLISPLDIPNSNTSTQASPTFNYNIPGTYYAKLVVLNRGTSCADSVYHAVNVSPPLRSRFAQTPVTRVCVNLPAMFDPFVTITTDGINSGPISDGVTTLSGNSLWTNPATNPIPMVWVNSFTGTNYTGSGINDKVELINYTGWINHQWATPSDPNELGSSIPGVTFRRPPKPAERTRIVNIIWDFGDGIVQQLTLVGLNTVAGTATGTNWQPLGGLQPRTTILGFNPATTALGNDLFLPRIIHAYASAGTNFLVSQTVISQFGCSSTASRRVTVVQEQPRVGITGTGVCLNNPQTTLAGFVSDARGAIWTGLNGTFAGVGMNNSRTFTGSNVSAGTYNFNTNYRLTPAELALGQFLNITLTSWGNGVCPAGFATSSGNVIVEQLPILQAGFDATICGNNTDYTLNGSVSGSSTGGNFRGRWRIITTSGLNSGGFVGIPGNTTTVLGATYRFSTANNPPTTTTNDKARGFVLLVLESINNGRCLTVYDTLRITMLPDVQNPRVNPGLNSTVCGNNRVVALNGSVQNSPPGAIWTRVGAASGFFGSANTISTTSLSGADAFYTPSPADSAAGSVQLRLTSTILSFNGSCFNVTTTLNITITRPPSLTISGIRDICPNNPTFLISGTITGATNGIWGIKDTPSVVGASFSPSVNMPNLTTLSGNRFVTSATVSLSNLLAFGVGSGNRGNIFLTIPGTNGCIGLAREQLVFVSPPPLVVIPSTAVVCKNNPNFPVTAVISPAPSGSGDRAFNANTTVQWSSSSGGTFLPNNRSRTITYVPSQSDTASGSVRLIVRADRFTDQCLSVFDTLDISYIAPPKVNAGPNLLVCQNNLRAQLAGSVTLNNVASTGRWSTSGNGVFQSNGLRTSTLLSDIYIPDAVDVGNNSVRLTLVTTGNNIGTITGQCAPISDDMDILFTPVPEVRMPATPIVCQGNPANISATITGLSPNTNITSATKGFWSGGGGTYALSNNSFTIVTIPSLGMSSVGSLQYTPNTSEIAALSVNLSLSVVGINNCAPFSVPYSYLLKPGPTIKIVNPTNPVCENNAGIVINATLSGANGVLWSGGGNSVSSSGSVATGFRGNYTPTSAEILAGSVKLFVSTQNEINNCSPIRDSVTIVINKGPKVTVGGDITSCIANANSALVVNILGSVSGVTNVGIWTTSGSGSFGQSTIAGGNMATTYTPSTADKGLPSINFTLTSANNGNCLAVFEKFNLKFSTTPKANPMSNQVVCTSDFPIILNNNASDAGSWSSDRNDGRYASTNANSSTVSPDSYFPVSTISGGSTITFRWTTNGTADCPSTNSSFTTTILSSPRVRIATILTITGNDTFIPMTAVGTNFIPGYFSTDGAGSFTSSGISIGNAQISDVYSIRPSDITRGFVNFTFTGLPSSTFCRPVVTTISVIIIPKITVQADLGGLLCADITQLTLSGKVFKNNVFDPQGTAVWSIITAAGSSIINPTSVVGARYNVVSGDLTLPRKVKFRIKATDLSGIYSPASLPSDSVEYEFVPAPVVSITSAPVEVCSDVAFISLSGTFTGAPSILWSATGAGGFNNNASPNVQYVPTPSDIASKSVSFVLLSQGSSPCTFRASNIVTVSITGKPMITAGPTENLCNNLTSITLVGANMTVTGAAPSVIWGISNTVPSVGTISSNIIRTNNVGLNPIYFPSTRERITNKLVTLGVTALGVGSCAPVTSTKIITFYDAPVITSGMAPEMFCGDIRLITLSGTTTVSPDGRWSPINGSGTFINTSANGKVVVYSVSGADVGTLNTTLGFQFITTFPGCNNELATKNIVLTSLPGVSILGSNGTLIKNPTICGDNLSVSFTGISKTGFATWINGFGAISPSASSMPTAILNITSSARKTAIDSGQPITIYLTSGPTGVCAARLDSAKITITPPPQVFAGIPEEFCENIPNITLSGAMVTVASGVIWTSPAGGLFSNNQTTIAGLLLGSGLFKTVAPVVYTPSTAERNSPVITLRLETTGSTVAGTCTEVFAQKTISFVKAPIISPLSAISRCGTQATASFSATMQNVVSQTWTESGNGGFSPDNTTNPVNYDFSSDEVQTTSNIVVTITVSALGNNLCPIVSRSTLLTITPRPIIFAGNLPNICSDSDQITVTGGSISTAPGLGVHWTNATNPGNTSVNFSDRFGLNPIFRPMPSDLALSTIKLIVTTTGNLACAPAKDSILLNISPRPTISVTGGGRSFCSSDVSSVNGVTFNVFGTQLVSVKVSSTGSGQFSSTIVGVNNSNSVTYYPSAQDIFTRKRVTIRFETLEKFNTVCGTYFETTNITFVGAPIVNAGVDQTVCFEPGKVVTLTGSVVGTESYLAQWSRVDFNFSTSAGVFLSNGNANVGAVNLVTTGSIDKMTIGLDDNLNTQFRYVVTGTGICNKEYFSTSKLVMPQKPNLTITAPLFLCNDKDEIALDYVDGGAWNDPVSLNTASNESLAWSAINSLNSVAGSNSFSRPGAFGTSPIYNLSPSDRLSNFILFTASTTGVLICPVQVYTVQVNLEQAPKIQSVSGTNYCSNITTGVPFSGIVTTTGSVGYEWVSSNPSNPMGTFSSPSGPTTWTSLAGTYFPSPSEIANGSATLVLKAFKAGCNSASMKLDISIKTAPVVDNGTLSSVCTLTAFNLTGSATPATTTLGVTWQTVIGSGSSTLNGPQINTINGNSMLATQNVSINSMVGGKILYEFKASEPGCNPVSTIYTFTGQTFPQPLPFDPQTLCGTDLIKMSIKPQSAIGTWSTTGLGSFITTGSKSTTIMNDTYRPAFGEQGTVQFILTSLPTGCGSVSGVSTSIELTPGMFIKASSKRVIAICKNKFPELKGTVTGTTLSKWKTSGSGTFDFANVASGFVVNGTSIGNLTTTGSPNVGIPHYEVRDKYTPSQADKDAGRVLLTMEAISDGTNTCGSNSDTLSLIFTAPPTAKSKAADRTECANTAISTLPGLGVSISGSVLFPTPNSTDSLATPTNSAYWQVIGSASGYFMSTKTNRSRSFSVTGMGTNVALENIDDVYIASLTDTATASQPIYLQLITEYIGTIVGADCNPAVDTIAIRFNRAPLARIISTVAGICADVTSIPLRGQLNNIISGVWSHNGLGQLSPSNNYQLSGTTYTLDASEENITVPKQIVFNLETVNNGSCLPGIATPLTVTIYPKPSITPAASQAICSDLAEVTLSGVDVKNGIFTSVTGFSWSSTGDGTFRSGVARNGDLLPAIYAITPSDESFRGVELTLSVSGQSTCKPLVVSTNISIVPRPKISVSPSQPLCRDIDQMPVNASVVEASGVLWSAFRCVGGNCTLPGTGIFLSNTNTSFTGIYVPSDDDRATSVTGILFAATTTGVYNSQPQCMQIITTTSINFTERPTIALGIVPAVCADAGTIPVQATVTGASQIDWLSSSSGRFVPSPFGSTVPIPSRIEYELSNAESNTVFESLVTITGTTNGNRTCKAYSAATVITITGRPLVFAGERLSVCADDLEVPMTVSGSMGNPGVTITGILPMTTTGVLWVSRSGGTFKSTGTSISGFIGDIYLPTPQERKAMAILELQLTGPNPCTLPSSTRQIDFNATPIISVSAGTDKSVCAGNRLVNLQGELTNVSIGTNGWYAIKPSNNTVFGITVNSFCGTCTAGRGTFSDIRDLNANYFPSIEDTLGATKATFDSPTSQKVWMVLTVNGLGKCASKVYADTMQVTFTSRPVIQVPVIPAICTNDKRLVTLTGQFLNPVAREGKWSTNGSGTLAFGGLQNNPPTISGVLYELQEIDKQRGQVRFTFTTQQMDDCEASVRTTDLIINPAPKFTPALQYFKICQSQSILGVNISGRNIQTAAWRSTGSGVFRSNNTNPGANLLFTSSGVTMGDGYIHSSADVSNGRTNLFIETTSSTGCIFGDTAQVVLEIDKLIEVDARALSPYCADKDTIPLSGTMLNTTSTTWTIGNTASGELINPNSLNAKYVLSTNDRTQRGLNFKITSNSPTSKCPVAVDSVQIQLTPLPIVSIVNDISICTITNIKIQADTQNVAYINWGTMGTGRYSSLTAKNTVYRPSESEITALGTNLILVAKGLNNCGLSTVSFNLKLRKDPVPNVEGAAGSDMIVCKFDSVLLNIKNPDTRYAYTWLYRTIAGINTVLSPISIGNPSSVKVAARTDDSLYILKAVDNQFQCIAYDTVKLKTIILQPLGLVSQFCFNDTLLLPVNKQVVRMPNSIAGGTFQWYRNGVFLNSIGANDTTGLRATIPARYVLEYTKFNCNITDATVIRDIPQFYTKGRVFCKNDEADIYPFVTFAKDSAVFANTKVWDSTPYNNAFGTRREGTGADTVRFDGDVEVQWNNAYNLANNPVAVSNFNFANPSNLPFVTIRDSRDSSKYLVKVTTSVNGLGCFAYDTVRIKTHPKPQMQMRNYPVCLGDLVSVDARPLTVVSPIYFRNWPRIVIDTLRAGYTWTFNGSALTSLSGTGVQVPITNSTLTVTEGFKGAGIYIAKFEIGECIAQDTSVITYDKKPVVSNEPVVKYCIDETGGVRLDAGAGNFRYLWLRSGNTSQFEQAYDTLTYYFKVFNKTNNCSVLDSVTVKQSCLPRTFIPEAFIPNGPNPDDHVFRVFGKYFKEFRLRIYNRWGELIFESKKQSEGWDGTYNGEPMPIGSYPYTLEYKGFYDTTDKVYIKKGAVTVIR